MQNKASWYLIKQGGLFHAVSKAEAVKLPAETYEIQQVFDTHREALLEMSRLIQLEIQDVKSHVNKLTDGDL